MRRKGDANFSNIQVFLIEELRSNYHGLLLSNVVWGRTVIKTKKDNFCSFFKIIYFDIFIYCKDLFEGGELQFLFLLAAFLYLFVGLIRKHFSLYFPK